LFVEETQPVAFFAFTVYSVVVVGLTLFVLVACQVAPLSKLYSVAPVAIMVKVEDSPEQTAVGEAATLEIVGEGFTVTLT
jgi:hypothetical protein